MGTVARSDLFGRVHKAIRKALFDLAYLAGRTDYTNNDEIARLKAQMGETLSFLRHHGHLEDEVCLPLIAKHDSSLTGKIGEDHHVVEEQIEAMEKALGGVESSEDRPAAGEAFYLQVNAFIASYLLHMHEEETEVAPLFFQHCTDEELQQMLQSIVARNTPAESAVMIKYAVPSVDSLERASFLGMIKRSVPPPVFDNVMKLVETTLNAGEWEKLIMALEAQETVA